MLQQIFLRFVLDPISQVSRLGVFSMNEHAILQLAGNTFGYDSNKMWSINPLALELDIYSLAHHLCKM